MAKTCVDCKHGSLKGHEEPCSTCTGNEDEGQPPFNQWEPKA